jgi:hypothetical protein
VGTDNWKQTLINKYVSNKYGKLTILSIEKSKNGRRQVNTICDCGATKTLALKDIIRGGTKSCGCLKRELLKETNKILGHSCRLAAGEMGFKHVLKSYKRQAMEFDREFLLTDEQFRVLTKGNCYYCDCKPAKIRKIYAKTNTEQGNKHGEYVYNGVDRVDNAKGYTLENCVSCCRRCNYLKSNLDLKVFIKHLQKIVKNMKGKI